MASNFPTSLDNFTNPSSGNTLDSPSHSLQHSDVNDAVEALERKIGVGTAVAGSASAGQVLTISAAGTSTWSTPAVAGLTQLVPSSVAVGSGSGSSDANGKVTFSAASTVSLNDVFSSTYDAYKIICNLSTGTDGANLGLRVRVSGTDNSSSNYENGLYYVGAYSSQVPGSVNSNINTFFGGICDVSSTAGASWDFTLYNPFATAYTKGTWLGTGFNSIYGGGVMTVTTSYTGFTLYVSSGTITGSVSVYGYK